MKTLLTIRARTLYRIGLEIGGLRSTFVIAFISYLLFQIFAIKDAYVILVINILTIFSLHTTRSDKAFLKSASVPTKLLFFLEYLILSTPFLIYFAFNQHLIAFFSSLIALLVISLSNLTFKAQQFRSVSFSVIPAFMFEWRSGLRQSWLLVVLSYLGSMVFYASPTIIILCNLLLIINFATFYLYGEDRVLVQLLGLRPIQFLFFKAKYAILFSVLLVFPSVLVLFIFHPDLWFVVALLLIINVCMQIFAVIQKYAVWDSNANLQGNMTLYLFYFISFVIPFLLPVGIFLFIRAYRKAIKNLSLVINN